MSVRVRIRWTIEQLYKDPSQIPQEIRELTIGPYAELVKHHVYYALGVERKPTPKTQALELVARTKGELPRVINAAETIAGIAESHYIESHSIGDDLSEIPFSLTHQDRRELATVERFLSRC